VTTIIFNDYDTKHYKHLLPKNRNLRFKREQENST